MVALATSFIIRPPHGDLTRFYALRPAPAWRNRPVLPRITVAAIECSASSVAASRVATWPGTSQEDFRLALPDSVAVWLLQASFTTGSDKLVSSTGRLIANCRPPTRDNV